MFNVQYQQSLSAEMWELPVGYVHGDVVAVEVAEVGGMVLGGLPLTPGGNAAWLGGVAGVRRGWGQRSWSRRGWGQRSWSLRSWGRRSWGRRSCLRRSSTNHAFS